MFLLWWVRGLGCVVASHNVVANTRLSIDFHVYCFAYVHNI